MARLVEGIKREVSANRSSSSATPATSAPADERERLAEEAEDMNERGIVKMHQKVSHNKKNITTGSKCTNLKKETFENLTTKGKQIY